MSAFRSFAAKSASTLTTGRLPFYENYVYVPVDVNESDKETLKQIPGLDDAMADALMAARPFPLRPSLPDRTG